MLKMVWKLVFSGIACLCSVLRQPGSVLRQPGSVLRQPGSVWRRRVLVFCTALAACGISLAVSREVSAQTGYGEPAGYANVPSKPYAIPIPPANGMNDQQRRAALFSSAPRPATGYPPYGHQYGSDYRQTPNSTAPPSSNEYSSNGYYGGQPSRSYSAPATPPSTTHGGYPNSQSGAYSADQGRYAPSTYPPTGQNAASVAAQPGVYVPNAGQNAGHPSSRPTDEYRGYAGGGFPAPAQPGATYRATPPYSNPIPATPSGPYAQSTSATPQGSATQGGYPRNYAQPYPPTQTYPHAPTNSTQRAPSGGQMYSGMNANGQGASASGGYGAASQYDNASGRYASGTGHSPIGGAAASSVSPSTSTPSRETYADSGNPYSRSVPATPVSRSTVGPMNIGSSSMSPAGEAEQMAASARPTFPTPGGASMTPSMPHATTPAVPPTPPAEALTGVEALWELDKHRSANEHPLTPLVKWAKQEYPRLEAIKDYQGVLIKQERIDDELKEEERVFVKVRHKPFSVYLYFIIPEGKKGQEALYVEGQNDGKLKAHGVGWQSIAGTLDLPPEGRMAMMGNKYPITDIGIANLVKKFIEVGTHDSHYKECYVEIKKHDTFAGRKCTRIQVVHPIPREQFTFHVARIYVDEEMNLPISYMAYGWPEKRGEKPPLLERYTYMDLQLNNGLTDADFDARNENYNF